MTKKLLMSYLSRYPTYPGFVSGGEQHFIEVCKQAQSCGWEIGVLTCPIGAHILAEHGLKNNTYVLSVPGERFLARWHNIGLTLVYMMRLMKIIPRVLLSRNEVDIVCATSHFLPDVLPAIIIAQRSDHAKFLSYIHHLDPPPWKAENQRLSARIFSWINSEFALPLIRWYARAIITVSPIVRQDLIKKGVDKAKITISGNGVDFDRISNTSQSETNYEACYFGRLAPNKGVFDIVEIWAQVVQHHPKARIAIIGGDGDRIISQVHAKIKDNGLENNIILVGFVPENEKYSLIKSCQIFISPSYEEGWGIAVCEALACGLPVVAYNLPAYEVFGDSAIVKVPIGDKRAFGEAISNLLEDKALQDHLNQEGRAVARLFSWEKIAEQELALFNRFAAGTSS